MILRCQFDGWHLLTASLKHGRIRKKMEGRLDCRPKRRPFCIAREHSWRLLNRQTEWFTGRIGRILLAIEDQSAYCWTAPATCSAADPQTRDVLAHFFNQRILTTWYLVTSIIIKPRFVKAGSLRDDAVLLFVCSSVGFSSRGEGAVHRIWAPERFYEIWGVGSQ